MDLIKELCSQNRVLWTWYRSFVLKAPIPLVFTLIKWWLKAAGTLSRLCQKLLTSWNNSSVFSTNLDTPLCAVFSARVTVFAIRVTVFTSRVTVFNVCVTVFMWPTLLTACSTKTWVTFALIPFRTFPIYATRITNSWNKEKYSFYYRLEFRIILIE